MKTWRILCLLTWALPVFGDPLPVTWVNAKDFVLMSSLAKAYGMKLDGPKDHQLTLSNDGIRLVFTTDGREVMVNGTLVWMHEPMSPYRGHWMIRAADAQKIIDPLMRPGLHLDQSGYRVVVLDPGHGGQDTGTKGPQRVEEKRVVLDIARRVRNLLKKEGCLVYVTRDNDRFIELDERTRKAKNLGADVFVSIHLNSAPTDGPNGTETYALTAANHTSTSGGESSGVQTGNKYDGPNTALAYLIHRSLCNRLGEGDRGLKRARFMVLKTAACPATLVECAFLSNPHEEERLKDVEFRNEIAEGIAKGIQDYLLSVKKARSAAP